MASLKDFADKTAAGVKDLAAKGTEKINSEKMKEAAALAGAAIADKADEVKAAAAGAKESIDEKLYALDRMLESSITEYNDAYTLANDKGVQLFIERTRSVDVISLTETIVNSIANRPKTFDADFEEILLAKNSFVNSCDFAERELQAARLAAGGAGAGLAAGASVAFMAPSAAMWVATTFGTASTGTAISALSGAAASNAALAWLGGGALAAGGGGMSAGSALLALSGPIGWSIAGATLLTSILLFTAKKTKLNKQKNEEIQAVKNNIARIREIDAQLQSILDQTVSCRNLANESCSRTLSLFGKNYSDFTEDEKNALGALVNAVKALARLMTLKVKEDAVEKAVDEAAPIEPEAEA